jgi:sporulation protein YlmC with PRC-barrel domain
MTTSQDPQEYIHRAAVDHEGNRIGKISQVYLDEQTGQPQWLLVETGLLGTRQSFAPVHGSRFDGELVVLAVSKDQVKDAPNPTFIKVAGSRARQLCDLRVCSALAWNLCTSRGIWAVGLAGAVRADGEDLVGRDGRADRVLFPPRIAADRASGLGAYRG